MGSRIVFDIGNTCTKVGVFKGDEALYELCCDSLKKTQLEKLFDRFPDISSSALSSVGEMPDFLEEMLQQRTHYINIKDAKTRLPIRITYQSRDTLGEDRWLALVGARKYFPEGPVLSVSFGTCITFNFLNAENEFEGGSISPGLKMRYDALHHFTRKLPLLKKNEYADVASEFLGKTTQDSIKIGVEKGLYAEIIFFIRQYIEKNPDISLIFCGGDMKYFDFSSEIKIFANSNLVLLGLNEIIKVNE